MNMCAKEEYEKYATNKHRDVLQANAASQSSRASREDVSIQEESRFAGWFWRSTLDRKSQRLWAIWLFILLINAGIIGYATPFFGVWQALIFFLVIQIFVSIVVFPNFRKFIGRKIGMIHRSLPHKAQRIYPLADVEFYLVPTKDVLLISHKGGLSATGLLVVDKLPVGIRGNMSAFIRAVYSTGLPLFYTLLHAPVPEERLPQLGALSDKAQAALESYDPSQLASFAWHCGGVWKTRLLLGTRRDSSNLDDGNSQGTLESQVRQDLQTLQMAFRTAYPHIRLRRLTNQELEDGIRSTLLLGKPPHFF